MILFLKSIQLDHKMGTWHSQTEQDYITYNTTLVKKMDWPTSVSFLVESNGVCAYIYGNVKGCMTLGIEWKSMSKKHCVPLLENCGMKVVERFSYDVGPTLWHILQPIIIIRPILTQIYLVSKPNLNLFITVSKNKHDWAYNYHLHHSELFLYSIN